MRYLLLHGLLHEELRYETMSGLKTVSGAQSNQVLCITTMNKKCCIAHLRKRQQYHKPTAWTSCFVRKAQEQKSGMGKPAVKSLGKSEARKCCSRTEFWHGEDISKSLGKSKARKCCICDKHGHFASKC